MTFYQILFSVFVYVSAAICGALIGGILGFFAGAWYVDFAKITQREGTSGYMVVFLFTPIGAFIEAVATLIGMAIRRHYY